MKNKQKILVGTALNYKGSHGGEKRDIELFKEGKQYFIMDTQRKENAGQLIEVKIDEIEDFCIIVGVVGTQSEKYAIGGLSEDVTSNAKEMQLLTS